MSPTLLLATCLAITLVAICADRIVRAHRARRLRLLAATWRMNYSPTDRFRLTPRLVRHFPVPGAAKIEITDLIYGGDGDVYRYIFTAAYTTGIMTGKRRIHRAASFCEPGDRPADPHPLAITFAPVHLPLLDQYAELAPTIGKTAEA